MVDLIVGRRRLLSRGSGMKWSESLQGVTRNSERISQSCERTLILILKMVL